MHDRYHFKRMPFGIISAKDEFQRKIKKTFEDLEGFVVIVDNLLIYRATIEEHDKCLLAILERARLCGFRLNK